MQTLPGDPIQTVRARARELFESQKYNCAEAVFLAANEVFSAGLDPATAARIATGLGGGLGATGGTCGALTGAVLAIGLIAGADPAVSRRTTVYPLAAAMQKRFKKRFGSSICKKLTRGITCDRRAHCSPITAEAAAMCAGILLDCVDATGRRS